eukprot:CAMPEP_0176358436 /NCGR_PEP_ID=MMETSP0126-20121128/15550_1 /TAXON_ID=141414 ORGANISM="Strombidinopsis acuminatum, Strain SPMC142" /NCGR_SAMPLE_ID=MMETSP0126 /ASSEMBLY_ACC=CAM_ASM_000229 /LENGTH=123 /DNA_ID=CAMNT_0017712599 /DNA_START=1206 /DNA_END=1577 /DNA_ORIENTATION=+
MRTQKAIVPDYVALILDIRDNLDYVYGDLSADSPALERKKSSYSKNIKRVGSYYYETDPDDKDLQNEDVDEDEEEGDYRPFIYREFNGKTFPVENMHIENNTKMLTQVINEVLFLLKDLTKDD